MVQFGLFWQLDRGVEALRMAREVIADMCLDINAVVGAVNVLPAPFVPSSTPSGRSPRFAVAIVGLETSAELLAADRDWYALAGRHCAHTL